MEFKRQRELKDQITEGMVQKLEKELTEKQAELAKLREGNTPMEDDESYEKELQDEILVLENSLKSVKERKTY